MPTDLHEPPVQQPPSAAPPVGQSSARLLRVTLGLILIAAGVSAGLALLGQSGTTHERSTTTHQAVDRIVLDLDAVGDVEVRAHDADEIVVDTTTRSTLSEVEVTQTVVGDALRLSSSRCPRGLRLWFDRCSASFVLTVPPSTSVVGTMAHGELTVSGLGGDVEVDTRFGRLTATDTAGRLALTSGHGDVTVTRAAGDVELVTRHGHVEVTQAGADVHVRSNHGRLTFRDVTGTLDGETGHGAILADDVRGETLALHSDHGHVTAAPATPPRRASLTTGHGDVDVTLPAGAPAYAVDADASSGRVDVAVATDPGADHRMELRTRHGHVVVR